MKHFIQTLLTLLLTLGASAAILAEPPPKESCDGDVYEQLECKTGAIANQLGYTSDVAFEANTGLGKSLGKARLKHLKHSANKADRAALRHDAKTFKRLAKAESRGNKGQDLGNLMPLVSLDDDINGDEICDYGQNVDNPNAKCAAIELTNTGDLQECNPEKKNKGKGKGKGKGGKFDGLECDRFMDFGDDEKVDMELAALNLLESYESTEENLLEINETLDDVNVILAESAAVFNVENGEIEVDCTDGIDNDGDDLIDGFDPDCTKCVPPKPNIALRVSVITLREALALADGVGAVAADFAGQDAAGFNGRSLAAVAHTAWTVANMAYIAVEERENDLNSKFQDAMMTCIAQSADQIGETLNRIVELQGQLEYYVEVTIHDEHVAIMDNDDENTTEIVHVLNTPHGQRDDHPKP